ncbi:hypothetical protein F4802DRAFT_576398 [Xylaria palmicola]|nr:hypothetical protein F4802DRAFT_576398 [Xylaria palmicola]
MLRLSSDPVALAPQLGPSCLIQPTLKQCQHDIRPVRSPSHTLSPLPRWAADRGESVDKMPSSPPHHIHTCIGIVHPSDEQVRDYRFRATTRPTLSRALSRALPKSAANRAFSAGGSTLHLAVLVHGRRVRCHGREGSDIGSCEPEPPSPSRNRQPILVRRIVERVVSSSTGQYRPMIALTGPHLEHSLLARVRTGHTGHGGEVGNPCLGVATGWHDDGSRVINSTL